MAKSDTELLNGLLEETERLNETEEKAFASMLHDIESGRWAKLSDKQRIWAREVAVRLGIDEPEAENLVSSGKMQVKQAERDNLQKFLGTLERPNLPPHRRCRMNSACQKPRGHEGTRACAEWAAPATRSRTR